MTAAAQVDEYLAVRVTNMNNLQQQLHKMKPMPGLAALLDKAKAKRIDVTKMRPFIKQANAAGIPNR